MQKKIYLISIWSLFIIFLMPFSFSFAQQPIRVGVYNFEPLVFLDKQGQAQGLFVDVLNHIAEKEVWQIEYVSGSWNECLNRLKNKEIELLMSVAYSGERARDFDFTRRHLFVIWAEAYARRDSDVKSVLDLQGKTVSVVKGALAGAEFHNMLDQFGVLCRISEYAEYEDVLQSLKNAEADAGIFTNLYGRKVQNNPQLERTQIIFAPTKIRFAVKKNRNPEILSTLDRYFEAFYDGQRPVYDQFLNKWIGLPQEHVVFPQWLVWGFGIFIFISAVLLIFNLMENRRVSQKTSELTSTNHELSESQSDLQKAHGNGFGSFN